MKSLFFFSSLNLQPEIRIPNSTLQTTASSTSQGSSVDITELKMRLERIKKMATTW